MLTKIGQELVVTDSIEALKMTREHVRDAILMQHYENEHEELGFSCKRWMDRAMEVLDTAIPRLETIQKEANLKEYSGYEKGALYTTED
jgi:hypothetical protein